MSLSVSSRYLVICLKHMPKFKQNATAWDQPPPSAIPRNVQRLIFRFRSLGAGCCAAELSLCSCTETEAGAEPRDPLINYSSASRTEGVFFALLGGQIFGQKNKKISQSMEVGLPAYPRGKKPRGWKDGRQSGIEEKHRLGGSGEYCKRAGVMDGGKRK